jgi:glucosamine 6-phosphate synthetase-like amidotransferase/phosphosugar isomerase protein
MCRQVGIILGQKRRLFPEHGILLDIFTEMLVRSESGGPHATGVAVLREDRSHTIAKRPMPARRFVGHAAFIEALARFDDQATAIIGHNRWRTVGTERNNLNNHPVAMPGMGTLGTHNGTLANADEVFRRFGLQRAAEVDSEALFRLADLAIGDNGIDPEEFLRLAAVCRGQISAVLAAVATPGRVLVIKGNRPLEFRYSRRYGAVAYATEPGPLDEAIAASCPAPHDWRPMVVLPMTMLVFRREGILKPDAYRFDFVAR